MGTEGGTEGAGLNLAAVEAALREDPWSFGFFQAVRLLERLRPDRAGPGRFVDPESEVVRFSVHPSISFPPSEIHSLEVPDAERDEPARMSVNFLGLTGASGVLPYHYTLLVAERQRARDGALAAFLDLFHHRILSLFYRAWEKHRFTVAYERGDDDPVTDHLRDLVGVGGDSLRGGHAVPDEALIHYAGLLAPQQRSAVALEQLLSDYFDVPVAVEQFVGGWHPLPPRDHCVLDEEEEGAANRLGGGAVAGDEIWDPQSRIRVRVGPLDRERYDEFLPTGSAWAPLRAWIRFFTRDQFEFDVQLVLKRDEVPGCVLGVDDDAGPRLGWSTWIRSRVFARDADETILS